MGPGMALNLRLSGLLCALALAGVLGACGNVLAISGLAGGAGNQAIDLNSVSRQKIEAFGTPILRATLPARAMDLLMSPRNAKGDVTTWEAAEWAGPDVGRCALSVADSRRWVLFAHLFLRCRG